MKTLDEIKWKPVPIIELFDEPVAGKGKGLNHLIQTEKKGLSYIGATNRNNGVLCFVNLDEVTENMIQQGNCIGFIKNGDGSAGYAIYKHELFVSTSDVIYGYAEWVNESTGLFFVAAQDMIEDKYSHGYKRNAQHLRGDKVMLPVNNDGKPDYKYMSDYVREHRKAMLRRHRAYVAERIAELGNYVKIPTLLDKNWVEFPLEELFSVDSGKRLTNADKIDGTRPFIGATDNGNGVTGFVGNDNASKDSNVLGVNYNGAPCIAFYHPYECIFTDDVKRLHLLNCSDNAFVLLFFKTVIMQQQSKYGYGYKFKEKRMLRQKLMVPVNASGEPDYEYMEQYSKNMMLKKYRQYLAFLDAKEKEAPAK